MAPTAGKLVIESCLWMIERLATHTLVWPKVRSTRTIRSVIGDFMLCLGISTYEKPVIGNTTTSPAAIFPVEFNGFSRLLREAHLNLGSSDSQSVFTAFVKAGGPVKSRISACFNLVAFCMMSLVT